MHLIFFPEDMSKQGLQGGAQRQHVYGVVKGKGKKGSREEVCLTHVEGMRVHDAR